MDKCSQAIIPSMKRVPPLASLLRMVVIAVLALGTVALECTLYEAFDDARLGRDGLAAAPERLLLALTSGELLPHAPLDRRR
jgi:hypothetical protein